MRPGRPCATSAEQSAFSAELTAGSTDSSTASYTAGSLHSRTHAGLIGVSSSLIGTSR